MACGLHFNQETLLGSFFHWVALHFQEVKKGTMLGKTECFLHTQYLKNEAKFSAKTTGHCLMKVFTNDEWLTSTHIFKYVTTHGKMYTIFHLTVESVSNLLDSR